MCALGAVVCVRWELLSLCALGAVVSVCAGCCCLCVRWELFSAKLYFALPPRLTVHSRLLPIFIGPIHNNQLTHMNNLRDEENVISVDLLCVNACWGELDATVLVSNKQSFQCALL